MAEMETLSEAMTRLTESGYVRTFHATDRGMLIDEQQTRFDPTTMSVDETVRFEGVSDPDDQAILYGLSTKSGQLGLYCAAYGPTASSNHAAVITALPHLER